MYSPTLSQSPGNLETYLAAPTASRMKAIEENTVANNQPLDFCIFIFLIPF
jgi:hypothetical protein